DVAPEMRKTAKRILSAFWKERGARELERFKKRYACCKEIGRRSGMGQKRTSRLLLPPAAEPIVAPTTRVGRNEPCPCGSGKKYKRCCGAILSTER
ncbi:MAG: SEC-C metal-binding domain-containing protein, partial [Patescibacteria group bacterium]|nr:SEC-C metal-binding domain-containing protein [Patescibacteria group bacterium]